MGSRARSAETADKSEIRAYDDLAATRLSDHQEVTLTSPLTETASDYRFYVRLVRPEPSLIRDTVRPR